MRVSHAGGGGQLHLLPSGLSKPSMCVHLSRNFVRINSVVEMYFYSFF